MAAEKFLAEFIDRFKQITKIPRRSGPDHQEKMAEFLIGWATENKFVYQKDTYGNLAVTVGKKNPKVTPIILQAHMDMVDDRKANSNHQYGIDPIELLLMEIKCMPK